MKFDAIRKDVDPSMTRRQILLGIGALGATAAAFAMTPRRPIDLLGEAKLETLVPTRFGDWTFESKSGLVIPPADQLSRELYAQLLTRVYSRPDGTGVMLLIAQSPSQNGVLQVHRPETCYPAGGYALTPSEAHDIPLVGQAAIPSQAFTATSRSRTEQLLYWTRVGRSMPATWAEQRVAVAHHNLSGEVPDAVLVRASMLSPDRTGSLATLDGFIGSMLKSIPPASRQVLVAGLQA